MAEIVHDLVINANAGSVFDAVSTADWLNKWWTKGAAATPQLGGEYTLDFGPGYVWKATVSRYEPGKMFELTMTNANEEWTGTTIGFLLRPDGNKTVLSFYHKGWKEISGNCRFSSYCWAMYLRIMKRNIEFGEEVAYEKRLSV